MSAITWLHLSDLHFRASEQHTWDENIVLRALLTDVRERVESDGLRPDFVVVSGDIAFSGKPEEYVLARQFFDELLQVTGLPKERLFVVPGNHDVNRGVITRGAVAIASYLHNRDAIAEVLTTDVDRRLVLRRFNHYADFANDYFAHLAFDDEHYFFVRHFDLAGRKVAVIGLNSAWLSAGDQDLGQLALGERQVRQALDTATGADLRIALMHHPFDWLQEFDRNDCEPLLMQGCDLVLHGHLHRTGLQSLKTPDAAAMIVAAGACYETRQYSNSYNLVQLDLDTSQGTIYFRRYSDEQGGFWTKDVMTYRNVDEGRYAFRLPSPVIAVRAKSQREPQPVRMVTDVDRARLEESYLRRVLIECNVLPLAVIDPHAVARTRQQTMDLLPVYVALNTRTAVAVDEEDKGKHRRQPREMEPGRETRLLMALEAAARDRQMVLLGDPGSGKSTFANYLALCMAGAQLERSEAKLSGEGWLDHLQPAWTHGPLLPLRVTLRHLAASPHCDGTANGLWSFVEDTLFDNHLADYAPHLRQRLLEGGVLVLLDGLDEVPALEERKAVLKAVSDFANTYNTPANRYLVTCRSYAYQDPCCQLDGFTDHMLASFAQKQIDDFIGCWYQEVCRLGWKDKLEAEDLTQRLQAATRRPDLAPLASNPLQLTMMASLHFSWGRLPDDRVELYQEMVRLLLVRWQEARLGQDTGVTHAVSSGKLESALERVAFIAHRAQEGSEGTADVGEVTLRSVLKDYLNGSWDRAGELVTFIQERAGLLIWRGPEVYTFPHRSYQEYLAGSYLAVQPDFPDEAASLVSKNYAQWREVALWAVGVMARLKKMTHVAVDVAAALCPRPISGEAVSEMDWRTAALAGEALLEIGLKDVQARERHTQVLARVREWLVALVEHEALTPIERAAAGRTLAKLGDPREAVTNPEKMEFCLVPAGPFVMGSQDDPQAYDDEKPQHTCDIPYDYWIARHPVTNAQFQAFVDAGGYGERRYWKEAEAAGRWKDGKIKRRHYIQDEKGDLKLIEGEEGHAPVDYGEPFNLPNHPVVGGTWYEALAFTRWLSERLRKNVRLPSEAEWEKAASWDKGKKRKYPWGDEPDPNKANYSETGIGATSAVGCFPGGASPHGVMDMSGNVWEWTQSLWGKGLREPDFKYPYNLKDGRENLEAGNDVFRVLRGGAFGGGEVSVRCAVRGRGNPGYGGRYGGFRLVVVLPL